MGSVDDTKFKKFDLLLEGLYHVPKDQMLSLSIRFSDDVGDAKPNLGECGGRLVRDRFGKHVLVKFTFKDGSYALPDGDCLARALPGRLGEKVSYVVTNFGDIAVSLIRDEVFIQHEGLKTFLVSVATGKLIVSGT